jgi:hypothetical protein
MPNKNTILTLDNLEEWMHSTGYLLPRTPLELARFERLHHQLSHQVDCKAVDPLAIIQGTWKLNYIVSEALDDLSVDMDELRLAARKYNALPDHIIQQIKNNHHKKDGSDPGDNHK